MSANILLKDGLIDPAFIPASVVPANPVFESLAIVPASGNPGYLSVENDAGNYFAIQKDDDGSIHLIQKTGASTSVDILTAADAGASVVINAPLVNLGIASDATPTVQVLGSAGLGQVYDTRYNPISQPFQNPVGVFANWTEALTTPNAPDAPNTVSFDFTPFRSGLYALVNTLGIIAGAALNTQIDPAGIVEGYVSVGAGGSGNFVAGSGFIWNGSLGARASDFATAIDPLEWTQTCLFYLTAGTTYHLLIKAYKNATASTGTFNLGCFGQIIQMC